MRHPRLAPPDRRHQSVRHALGDPCRRRARRRRRTATGTDGRCGKSIGSACRYRCVGRIPGAARSRANPLGGAGGHRSSRHFLMQPGTIAMVLAAAVAHAVWNLASKYKRGDTLLFVWAYSCASTLLWVPIGLVLMVQGQGAIDWRLGVGAAVSAALHIAYSLTLQAGYDRAELGVVYPIARGTGAGTDDAVCDSSSGERLSLVALFGHSSLSQAFLSLPATRLEAEPAARSRGCFGEVLRGHHRKLYRLGQLCGHVAAFGAGELLRWHTASANPDPDAKRTAPMASHSRSYPC